MSDDFGSLPASPSVPTGADANSAASIPMIERMARAISPQAFIENPAGFWQPRARRFALKRARAALLAIREPSDAVLDAGALVGPDTNGGEFGYGDAHAVFTAMIDAILAESPQ